MHRSKVAGHRSQAGCSAREHLAERQMRRLCAVRDYTQDNTTSNGGCTSSLSSTCLQQNHHRSSTSLRHWRYVMFTNVHCFVHNTFHQTILIPESMTDSNSNSRISRFKSSTLVIGIRRVHLESVNVKEVKLDS